MDTAQIEGDGKNHNVYHSYQIKIILLNIDGNKRKERLRNYREKHIFLSFWLFSIPFCIVSCEKEEAQTTCKENCSRWGCSGEARDNDKEIQLTGSIEANTTVQVYPKITAQIEEMRVDSGDTIKKGKVIALLESDELKAQLAQAEAALETMRG